ncbi:MAG TPA: VCBS repeat-containing protein [Balneolales bacterium]|nr:VCBS repeat-containing protein [Balneolales bacterium]
MTDRRWALQILFLLVISFTMVSCNHREKSTKEKTLFKLLSPSQTHVTFNNKLTQGLNTNVLMYESFYNGGGVAVGDVNGDGRPDLYFSGNMTSNHLYLNEGHMHFKDITREAGVAGRPGPWKTGVTFVDINGDGKLDIYVCYSGNSANPNGRRNQLFINLGNDKNGVPQFRNEAKKYGLDNSGFSTQAYFFDYDHDGDLDLLLVNYNPQQPQNMSPMEVQNTLKKNAPYFSTRLLQNDNGHFVDVTKKAGLDTSSLSYGLGAGIADFNNDGWPDIYLTNDYFVPDYLYINNKNGTFTNELKSQIRHTSLSSMGVDVSDINNDGYTDIYSLDMLPESNYRQKVLLPQSNRTTYEFTKKVGFYYQYERNMLQLNNGNNTFSEIGQLAGISNTDWSWSPLFADFNNNGWKDLFITNGYLHDYTNMDFLQFMRNYLTEKRRTGGVYRKDLLYVAKQMPTTHLVNYIYRNNGNLTFTNMDEKWGMTKATNSNGAVYADLDNDGDLDLIMNNINGPASIYENEANTLLKNHYLEVKLKGSGKNTEGIGSKVTIFTHGKQQDLEEMPTRGFQSSVSPVLHFGLAQDSTIDSLRITWPTGKEQKLYHVAANQILTLNEDGAKDTFNYSKKENTIFEKVKSPVSFQHKEPDLNDFERQPLMVNPMSFFGPPMAESKPMKNGDQYIYIGGGNGQPGKLFIRQKSGRIISKNEPAFTANAASNDASATFLDVNGDGYPDLYVCSGGYDKYAAHAQELQDRLYLNDGKGHFTLDKNALPQMYTSTSCVQAADINGDGRPDLFVGGRVIPGEYPKPPDSYILINNGHGVFKDETEQIAPELRNIGMVTDAKWVDLNGDHKKDLIVVGEWMPVSVFINENGKLVNETKKYFKKDYRGWWNKILVGDFNKDGKPDIVVGNLGLNSQVKASNSEPARLYYGDFDNNGIIDPILCFYIQGKNYPYVTRDRLIRQMPSMQDQFPTYKSYANATITDLFPSNELKKAGILKANDLQTTYFESYTGADHRLHFKVGSLPIQAQTSPVFAMTSIDYNHDGNKDLLLFGNISHTRVRFGNYDSNYGTLLESNGKGSFKYIPQWKSGFKVKGDVRSVLKLGNTLLLGIDQGKVEAYKLVD